jgi:hypothetical protein
MKTAMDLSLDKLETIEAPITDMEWGVLVGVAFGVGVWIGVAIVAT